MDDRREKLQHTHLGVCVAAIAEEDGKIREKFYVIALGGGRNLREWIGRGSDDGMGGWKNLARV